jgi:hypothetical protein
VRGMYVYTGEARERTRGPSDSIVVTMRRAVRTWVAARAMMAMSFSMMMKGMDTREVFRS